MSMTYQNDRFLKALRREPVDATPIWIMRQAGRYLPEYRKLREQVPNFLEFCQRPELACEATLQPLARYDLDASILFSDILTIPNAMGMPLEFIKGTGPVFPNPIRDIAAIEKLKIPIIAEDLNYVGEATKLIVSEINGRIPLIGFCGSPWTLACYMIEGQGSKTFSTVRKFRYQEPDALKILLNKLQTASIDYLSAQVDAGVAALMVFDTWGGLLSTPDYKTFSLAPMKAIVEGVKAKHPDVPMILFTKNGGQWLEITAGTGCDGVGLDWTVDIKHARERIGNKVALQGNLDPAALYGSPESIRSEVKRILEAVGEQPGHIFNLGHGIYPDVPPENVEVLVNAVHEISRGFVSPPGLSGGAITEQE